MNSVFGRDLMRVTCLTLVLVSACAASAAEAPRTLRELPCPEPAPKFDPAKIDRALTEPQYASAKPAYRFLAFGPAGRHIVAMVGDESTGTGKGYDTLYVDLNGNRDLTEKAERFASARAGGARRWRGRADGDWITFELTGWGKTTLKETALPVDDPLLDYSIRVGYGMTLVYSMTKSRDFGAGLRILHARGPWSIRRDTAPVYRFGGPDFSLGNEAFVAAGKGKRPVSMVHKTVPIGETLKVSGTAPHFAGTTAGIPFGGGGLYVAEGYPTLKAWVESGHPAAEDFRVDFVFRGYCGSNNYATQKLTAFHPPGPAELILELDTRSYQGVIRKRIPFVIDNPLYGKPIAPLAEAERLSAANPGATVVELYQGAALPQWGVPVYDGVRDVYYGDGRPDPVHGGSCTNKGIGLSYGRDMRFELHVGGEARRTLIRYDLAMLPRTATVRKAVLMLHVRDVKPADGVAANVVALRKRWSETRIGPIGGLNPLNSPSPMHGHNRYPVGAAENWEQPLARGPGDRHAEHVETVGFARPGWVAVDLTAAVSRWLSGEWPNHGVVIEKPQARDTVVYGTHDLAMVASEYPVNPALRPRLVLVLDGRIRPTPHRVAERNADLSVALAAARKAGKRVVIHVLSAGSLTSRRFETGVLADPRVRVFLDARFVEVRLDGDRPGHAALRRRYGVRRMPSVVTVWPDRPEGRNVRLVEPFDWNAPYGRQRSLFEFEQLYTATLDRLPDDPARTGRRSGSCTSQVLLTGD